MISRNVGTECPLEAMHQTKALNTAKIWRMSPLLTSGDAVAPKREHG
jgi:hypothetical protein